MHGDVRPVGKLHALTCGESYLPQFEKPLHMTTARERNTTGRVPDNFTCFGIMERGGKFDESGLEL